MTADPFDAKAATWDADPAKVARAAAVARCIATAVPVGPSTRLLEYGAGTALVTQALRESVGPVTLADTSTGMRAAMQAKVDSGALVDARIWDLNLELEPPPRDEQFDLIVTVLTLHHVHDLARVLAGFASLLVPGGHLCIADLEQEDGSFHGADFDGHHGFDRTALASDLANAGFTDTTFTDCTQLERDGRTYPVFLATCALV
ncbi:MAG: class I SAM-dependent DNA methyltransferase [Actinomycetota bacterium]